MTSVLPTPEEVPALIPQRGDAVWRIAGDIRLLAGAGYALLLQVAHPSVGAGVAEHSNFAADPWGRLARTLDYLNATIYGGPELASETGRRVRGIHRTIKGTRPDGRPYHSLEPHVYAWVHASLAISIVEGHRHFGRRLSRGEVEQFYAGWRRVGRLVGVREGDLPDTWTRFQGYFHEMVENELEDNPMVHEVLESLRRPASPVRRLAPAWPLVSWPIAQQMHLVTLGLMPAGLREKLGLGWSALEDAAFKTMCTVSRAGTPLVHGPMRLFGPTYLRWRQDALAT